jgi:hypothetical protein
MHIGLLALTVALATRGRERHLALIPAGTSAAILLFVVAGGPVMLATWLAAAALALNFARGSRPAPLPSR